MSWMIRREIRGGHWGRRRRWLALLGLCGLLTNPANAVEAPSEAASQFTEDEIRAIESLSLYSPELREAVLEVTRYPKVIEDIAANQLRTSRQFRERIEKLPRDSQEKIWEIVRYPAVVDLLIAHPEANSDALKKELDELHDVPGAIRDQAASVSGDESRFLAEVQSIRRDAEEAFNTLLDPYPLRIQSSFRSLVDQPETLSLLAERPDLTEKVARAYRADPVGALRRLGEMGDELSERYERDLEEWEAGLEADPELEAEMRRASEDFAREEGLDTTAPVPEEASVTTQMESGEPEEERETSTSVSVYVQYAHYPYWYGYPYWYSSAYWRPRPYWSHWGWYYGPSRGVVVIGYPSYRYSRWHFSHYRYGRYPRYSAYRVGYVQRHPSQFGGNRAVGNWVGDNRNRLPNDYLKNDAGLSNRMQELSQFDRDFDSQKGNLSRSEFADKNRDRYKNVTAGDRASSVDRGAQAANRGTQATNRDRQAAATRERSASSRTSTGSYQRQQRARDYHQGSWQGSGRAGARNMPSGGGMRGGGGSGGARRR